MIKTIYLARVSSDEDEFFRAFENGEACREYVKRSNDPKNFVNAGYQDLTLVISK